LGYVTLYRKWRPQTFEDVVGQEHIIRTLTNALKEDRVAHAYIFSGPRGTGKTSVAKILAKALNCDKGPTTEPCNTCSACVEITAGSGLDVMEIDAASNRGIDEIRDLREKVKFAPAGGGTKVYIIDEVHMLTPEAFNALLKMLEEPPSHVIFILATTEPHKVLPTILSRCQRFDFRRLKTDELAGRLRVVAEAEKIDIDDPSIALIAKQSKGGMRDAISTLDQLSSYTGNVIRTADVTAMLGIVDANLLFSMAELIQKRDIAGTLRFINEIVEAGWDLRQFAKDLTEHFRNLFVIKNTKDHAEVVNATAEELKRLEAQADGFSPGGLTGVIEALSALNNEMRYAADPRLVLELALVKLTAPRQTEDRRSETGKQEAKTEDRRPETEKQKIKTEEPKTKTEEPKVKTEEVEAPKTPVPKGQELDTVKRAWKAVLEQVKKKKMSTYALIVECMPAAVEGKTVVLEFNERAAFHIKGVENDATRKFIEGILRDVTGQPYVIQCVMGAGNMEPKTEDRRPKTEKPEQAEEVPPLPESADITPAVEEAPVLSEEEGISKLTGLFDATVLNRKERNDES
jgi:DNA polymerase III subunit gamma/tau